MIKKELRNTYKEKRLALSLKEKLKADDLLLIQFQQLVFEDITVLLSYWPIEENAEPNTHLFSRYLGYMIPGLQVAYPVTDFTMHSMQAVAVDEHTRYIATAKKIIEPKDGVRLENKNIDLVFVPLLACDLQGFRVGYGKGFYDRFLALCREDTIKVGFSYFPPVEKIEDTNTFDVPLDYCITPQNIYEF